VQERKGRKRVSQRCGKSDERAFIPEQSCGLAALTPISDAAGGEGVREAAKPDGVIHRYLVSPRGHTSSRLHHRNKLTRAIPTITRKAAGWRCNSGTRSAQLLRGHTQVHQSRLFTPRRYYGATRCVDIKFLTSTWLEVILSQATASLRINMAYLRQIDARKLVSRGPM
jgi:hypothetical protein